MKLLGSDFDGTLNHHGIDEEKLQAIRDWRAAGNKFGVVSGRGPGFEKELAEKLGDQFDFLISCNGGIIALPDGTPLHAVRCETLDIEEFCRDLYEWGGTLVYFLDHRYFTIGCHEDIPEKYDYLLTELPPITYFYKLCMDLKSPEKAREVADKIRAKYGDQVYAMQNWGMIDIAPAGVNKASGLRWLAAHYGIAEEDIIAVGDYDNDADMIREFRSYAMENGCDYIKELADFTTPSVTDLIRREMEL